MPLHLPLPPMSKALKSFDGAIFAKPSTKPGDSIMRMLKMFGPALFLGLGLAVTSAQANVIYSFAQTGTAMGRGGPNSVLIDATVTVTDAASASGFNFSIVNDPFRAAEVAASTAGLVDLNIVIRNGRSPQVEISLADYLTYRRPVFGMLGALNLVAAPGGLPSGFLTYTAQVISFEITTLGTGIFSGNVRADGGIPCFFAPCSFAGVVTQATQVAEPASLALFGFGLAALGVARRRARASLPGTPAPLPAV